MMTLQVRKQGGAAVITLPADILRLLDIEVGDTLTLDVADKKLVFSPMAQTRQRYTLNALLEGATPATMKKLQDETKWFREDEAVGRELT